MKKNKSKILHTIIRVIIILFIAIAIGMGIYNFNAKRVANDSMPMPLGIGASVVLSGSMEPELSVNDLILVRKTDDFYIGQVVVYQDNSDLVVHRIESINGDEVITKGDANNSADRPISKNDIKGEVLFSIPGVGIFVEIVKNPLVLIMVGALAMILLELSYKSEKKTEKEELDSIKKEIKDLMDDIKKD